MSIWPPGRQNDLYLMFQCPNCRNELRFAATPAGEGLLWYCQNCGNHINLNLIAVNSQRRPSDSPAVSSGKSATPIKKNPLLQRVPGIH